MQDEQEFQEPSLDDVLGDGAAPATDPATAEPEPAAEPEPTGEQSPETPEPATPPVADEPEDWTKAKALDERQKRQEAEQRIALLERQLEHTMRQPEPEIPDAYEDPEGYTEHVAGTLEQRFANELYETRKTLSEEVARSRHEDYDEVVSTFVQLANSDPTGNLISQLHSHPNPAGFAYNLAKQHLLMNEVKDPEAYRQKVREEIMAELKAGTTAQPAPSPAASAPTSLASVPSAPPATAETWPGPESLEELIDD